MGRFYTGEIDVSQPIQTFIKGLENQAKQRELKYNAALKQQESYLKTVDASKLDYQDQEHLFKLRDEWSSKYADYAATIAKGGKYSERAKLRGEADVVKNQISEYIQKASQVKGMRVELSKIKDLELKGFVIDDEAFSASTELLFKPASEIGDDKIKLFTSTPIKNMVEYKYDANKLVANVTELAKKSTDKHDAIVQRGDKYYKEGYEGVSQEAIPSLAATFATTNPNQARGAFRNFTQLPDNNPDKIAMNLRFQEFSGGRNIETASDIVALKMYDATRTTSSDITDKVKTAKNKLRIDESVIARNYATAQSLVELLPHKKNALVAQAKYTGAKGDTEVLMASGFDFVSREAANTLGLDISTKHEWSPVDGTKHLELVFKKINELKPVKEDEPVKKTTAELEAARRAEEKAGTTKK